MWRADVGSRGGRSRLAHRPGNDFVSLDVELGGANVRAADYGDDAGHLLAGDQAEDGAQRACQHRPVWVSVLAVLARVVEHKQRSGTHLLGDPVREIVDL